MHLIIGKKLGVKFVVKIRRNEGEIYLRKNVENKESG